MSDLLFGLLVIAACLAFAYGMTVFTLYILLSGVGSSIGSAVGNQPERL